MDEVAPVRIVARDVRIGICAHDGVGHLKLPFDSTARRTRRRRLRLWTLPDALVQDFIVTAGAQTHEPDAPRDARDAPSAIRLQPRPNPCADRLECVWPFFNRTFRKTSARPCGWAPVWASPVDVIEPCGFPLSDRRRDAARPWTTARMAEVTRHASWTDFLAAPEREAGRLRAVHHHAAPSRLHDFAFAAGDTLLFGRESAGVPDEVHAAAEARLFIPLAPGARSLNRHGQRRHRAFGEALRQTDGFPTGAPTRLASAMSDAAHPAARNPRPPRPRQGLVRGPADRHRRRTGAARGRGAGRALSRTSPAASTCGPGRGRPASAAAIGGSFTGRLFEKAGVHTSAATGRFSPEMAATMPGADKDPSYVSASISLIVHPRSPARAGRAHEHPLPLDRGELVRRRRRPDADAGRAAQPGGRRRGRSSTPPCRPPATPTTRTGTRKYKAWCDEYFFLPHRNEPRGVGGIFYDRHNSGDFERDFAFTRAVGEAFLDVYPKIVRHRMDEPWTEADREEQLVRRGRYVEFNLLYDRGTMFGLKAGGNIETILSLDAADGGVGPKTSRDGLFVRGGERSGPPRTALPWRTSSRDIRAAGR